MLKKKLKKRFVSEKHSVCEGVCYWNIIDTKATKDPELVARLWREEFVDQFLDLINEVE